MQAKYGVDHALQHPAFHRKQQSTAFSYRIYSVGSRKIRVQGFEDFALEYLLEDRNIHPDRIRASMDGTIPRIPYENGKILHHYFPDFMVDEVVVEVKSTWTLLGNRNSLRVAKLKARASIALGHKFVMLVVLRGTKGRHHVLKLPKTWLEMKYKQLKLFVDNRRIIFNVVNDSTITGLNGI
jgi:hypothetical protein